MKNLIGLGLLTIVLSTLTLSISIQAQEATPEETPVNNEQEAENARLVERVYAQLVNERDYALLDQYWGESFIQHNSMLPDGREVLSGFVSSLPAEARLHIYRVIADGDLVVTHAQLTMTEADRDNEFAGLALIDIFRVVDGLIVEHWDVVQNIPAETVNGHSMFDGTGQSGE